MNERLIRDEQDRIDNLDGNIDSSLDVSDDNLDYAEVVFDKVDEVLQYMQILDSSQQNIMQSEILGVLTAIDSENIDFLVSELRDQTNEWLQIVDVEASEMISNLSQNFELNFNPLVQRDYALKIVRNQVDEIFIQESLDVVLTIVSELPDEQVSFHMLSVFGKLVNGQRENLLDANLLNSIVSYNEDLSRNIQDEISTLRELQINAQRSVRSLTIALVKEAQENNEWFEDRDEQVDQLTIDLKSALDNLNKIDDEYNQKNHTLNLLLESSLSANFLALKSLGDQSSVNYFASRVALSYPHNLPLVIANYIRSEDYSSEGLSDFQVAMINDDSENPFRILYERISSRERLSGIGGRGNQADLLNIFSLVYRGGTSQRFTPDLVSRENRIMRKVASRFAEGSFGAQKIQEGYSLIQLDHGNLFGYTGRRIPGRPRERRNFRVGLFLCKKLEDGSFSYVRVRANGSPFELSIGSQELRDNLSSEHVLNQHDQERVLQDNAQIENDIEMLYANDHDIHEYQNLMGDINFKVSHLRALLNGLSRGEKTQESVQLVRRYASELRSIITSRDLSGLSNKVKGKLTQFNSLFQMGIESDFESKMNTLSLQISNLERNFNERNLLQMCDRIQSQDFSVDNFFLQTVLPMLGAITVAVGAVLLAFPSGGVSLLALGGVSAVGTLGGMVGHELTTFAVEATTDIETRTMLGAALMGSRFLNPETNQYESVSLSNLAQTYGSQFVIGTVQTFALMGAGRFVGSALSKFANNHALSEGVKGFFARGLQRVPRIGRTESELLRSNGTSGFISRFMREVCEELTEESIEMGAYQVHPAFGFMASVLVCTRMNNIKYKLAGHQVVESGVSIEGDTLVSNFTYDSASQGNILADVESKFPDMNLSVDNDTGVVNATSIQRINGRDFQVQMRFEPSNQPLFVRSLKSNQAAIDNYGLSFKEGSIFYASNLSDNHISLDQFLESQGVVVLQENNGNKIARFGNQSVNLIEAGNADVASNQNVQPEGSNDADVASNQNIQPEGSNDADVASNQNIQPEGSNDADVASNQNIDLNVDQENESQNRNQNDLELTNKMQVVRVLNEDFTLNNNSNSLEFLNAVDVPNLIENIFVQGSNHRFEGDILIVEIEQEVFRFSMKNYFEFNEGYIQNEIAILSVDQITRLFSSSQNFGCLNLGLVSLYIKNNNPVLATEMTNNQTVHMLRNLAISDQVFAENALEYTFISVGKNAEKNVNNRPVISFKELGGGGFGRVHLALYFDQQAGSWINVALKLPKEPGYLIGDIQECQRFFNGGRMQSKLRSLRGLNQPLHIDLSQEFILMETFDNIANLNPRLRGVDSSDRPRVSREYMDSVGSVLDTMERMWSINLYHGDLKPGNAMAYVDENGDRQTIVIDVAPHGMSEYDPTRGIHTPNYSIRSDLSSFDPQIRAAAISKIKANKRADTTSASYLSFASPIELMESKRLAVGFDLRSIAIMIQQHVESNSDLYSPDQMAMWNQLVQMSQNYEQAHSVEYLNAMRSFISSTSGRTFEPIDPRLLRNLPSVNVSSSTSGLGSASVTPVVGFQNNGPGLGAYQPPLQSSAPRIQRNPNNGPGLGPYQPPLQPPRP